MLSPRETAMELEKLFPEHLKAKAQLARQEKSAQKTEKKVPPGKTRAFVGDFAAGAEVDEIFLVEEATFRLARNGTHYILGGFADRTGVVAVRKWDATEEEFSLLSVGGYVRARGRLERYQGRLQMIVTDLRRVDESEVEPADFIPVTKGDIEQMFAELTALAETVKDETLRRFLQVLLGDPQLAEGLRRSPAANMYHHAWVGGLLEHTLATARVAMCVCEYYPLLNRDLLLTGVILHDLGKITELSPQPGFHYTDEGRLVGHVVAGALLVERVCAQVKEVPEETRNLLLHLALSHHGTREFGAPVLPATAEALALHHLECLDAKLKAVETALENAPRDGSHWTEYQRMFDGRLYVPEKYGHSEPE